MTKHDRRVANFPQDVRDAHDHCSFHRAEILASESCGCFHCGAIFPPTQIIDWVDWIGDEGSDKGQTALCPQCAIDSVIGDRSGFPITGEFLAKMKSYWF